MKAPNRLIRATIIAVLAAATASCGGGGSSGPAPAGTLNATDCVIDSDAMTCASALTWSTADALQPRVTAGSVLVSTAPSGSVAVPIGSGETAFELRDGSISLAAITVRGSCAPASAWDGLRCMPFASRSIERAATPFVEDGRAVTLEVVIYTPLVTASPYPAVMFNHGSTGNGDDPSLFRQTFTNEAVARFFAERGWLVAFPQRRGRGQSDGIYDEGFEPDRSRYSCLAAHSLPGFDRALADLDAATDHLLDHSDVDPARMIEAGTSRGGILAVAHVARRPDAMRGAVNFVGGWLGEACVDAVPVNRSSFLRGAGFPGASLWLYAENDTFYSIAHSRSNFDSFVTAGGSAAFHVHARAPGLNGHFLHNDPALWGTDVESYIAAFQ
jgi:dienelactone hydrolase